jgi:hypothetical protein
VTWRHDCCAQRVNCFNRRRGQRPAVDRETVSRVLIHRSPHASDALSDPPKWIETVSLRGLSHDHYFHPLSNSRRTLRTAEHASHVGRGPRQYRESRLRSGVETSD